ncbi:hypothetical protein SynRS9902_00657 [Synechococcus sp. RS9902]|nr:hypothetical protein SynRS9902_00657 [Synechococcus sp. RS9902]
MLEIKFIRGVPHKTSNKINDKAHRHQENKPFSLTTNKLKQYFRAEAKNRRYY